MVVGVGIKGVKLVAVPLELKLYFFVPFAERTEYEGERDAVQKTSRGEASSILPHPFSHPPSQ